ncbi:BrnT family toxin [bacterium]|nr:BrnT family toxin [bacterium]
MNFEWDECKNKENIKNHGIDFNDAIEIFSAPRFEHLNTRFDYDEPRYITIGFCNNRIILVAYSERNDKIRLISARKANAKEKKSFQNRLGKG